MKYIPSQEIIDRLEKEIPVINTKALSIPITFRHDPKEGYKVAQKKTKEFLLKNTAMSHLECIFGLAEEIRLSHIYKIALLGLQKEQSLESVESCTINWIIKYYIENSIYRYYSLWEMVGLFLNDYYGLNLELNRKRPDTEKNSFAMIF